MATYSHGYQENLERTIRDSIAIDPVADIHQLTDTGYIKRLRDKVVSRPLARDHPRGELGNFHRPLPAGPAKELQRRDCRRQHVGARGIVGADARPNWQEQPQRESLTGVQWR
jgi:hypothetical protein